MDWNVPTSPPTHIVHQRHLFHYSTTQWSLPQLNQSPTEQQLYYAGNVQNCTKNGSGWSYHARRVGENTFTSLAARSHPEVLLAALVSMIILLMLRFSDPAWYFLNMFLALMTSEALAQLVSHVVPHFVIGMAMVAGLFGFFMLFQVSHNSPSLTAMTNVDLTDIVWYRVSCLFRLSFPIACVGHTMWHSIHTRGGHSWLPNSVV